VDWISVSHSWLYNLRLWTGLVSVIARYIVWCRLDYYVQYLLYIVTLWSRSLFAIICKVMWNCGLNICFSFCDIWCDISERIILCHNLRNLVRVCIGLSSAIICYTVWKLLPTCMFTNFWSMIWDVGLDLSLLLPDKWRKAVNWFSVSYCLLHDIPLLSY
jgi:hypothetical protein